MIAGPEADDAADWTAECEDWLQSLASTHAHRGKERTAQLLRAVLDAAAGMGVSPSLGLNSPYRNTIGLNEQPAYPGEPHLEQRLENAIRWNAMAMVLQASDAGHGLGGHIATYASAAALFEVGFNHFFRNRSESYGGDIVNLQPHASPGVYARAFLEGRLTQERLRNFRRELADAGGLCSYPHPRRMPQLWPCPTASMGLSTVISIYLARFRRYLENRGLLQARGGKVWCFIGDGEADEPEVLGTIPFAAREKLDDLILVINCNLQRLTLSDEEIRTIRRGGHDPVKIHAAYRLAMRSDGRPTVILAKTIKGFGMGSVAEGRNAAQRNAV